MAGISRDAGLARNDSIAHGLEQDYNRNALASNKRPKVGFPFAELSDAGAVSPVPAKAQQPKP